MHGVLRMIRRVKENASREGFLMRPENEARLAKIKKISRILQGMCTAFLVLCVLGFLVMTWFLISSRYPIPGGGHGIIWEGYNGVAFNVYDLTDRDRVVAVVFFALSWGVVFNCGYQLHRLLDNYSRGEVFTSESAGQIRKWGIACVLWGVMKFGWMLVPLVIANAYKKPGEGLSLVVNGLIIVAISWFMEMAAEMREEQDLIV
jgi:hypothetical protein